MGSVKAIESKTILFETLEPKLVADDDHALWRAALFVLADEVASDRGRNRSAAFGRWSWVNARTGLGRTIADGMRQVVLSLQMATKIPFRNWIGL